MTLVEWVHNLSFLFITISGSLIRFYMWPLVLSILPWREGGGNIYKEPVRYALKSVVLGVLAVMGPQQGIVRGLHPFISSALGITFTLGGMVRDLMCLHNVRV